MSGTWHEDRSIRALPVIVLSWALFLAIGMLALASSCGAGAVTTQAGSTFTGSFSACAKADLPTVIQSLESQVEAIILTDGASLEADLTTLAGKVGIDAVECAIAAVEAVIGALTSSGSGSGVAARALPDGLVRAKAWLVKARAAQQASSGTGSAR